LSDEKKPNFRISVGGGYVTVEAPSKEDCLEIFGKVSERKQRSPIEEAIR
jgi:hypothetical protein